jgi:hypothetical protein
MSLNVTLKTRLAEHLPWPFGTLDLRLSEKTPQRMLSDPTTPGWIINKPHLLIHVSVPTVMFIPVGQSMGTAVGHNCMFVAIGSPEQCSPSYVRTL